MGSHSHAHSIESEVTRLKPGAKMLGLGLMVAGAVGIAGAVGTSFATPQHGQRFFWALLFGVAGYLAISCSALIFVLINHLVRAGWITNVRRVLETLAVQIPLLGLLLLPVIVVTGLSTTVEPHAHHDDHAKVEKVEAAPKAADDHADNQAPATGEKHDDHAAHAAGPQGMVYSWAVPGDTKVQHHHADLDAPIKYPNEQVQPGITRGYDPIVKEKRDNWLKPGVWAIRLVINLVILSAVAWYYRKKSIEQDASGDVDISTRLMSLSAPLLFACGLIVTFVAFDVFMSLDPHWFSTMYGVYFFATGTQAMWSVMTLTFIILQSRGYLTASVTKEHYHDLGKFMWCFIVFFAYIAFSQYMLQWYANMPEETFWYDKRGYSTAHPNGYSPLVIALLIGRFCIPFLGLVSRHVKRSKFGITFWAIWLLAFFVVDIYLLVIPEFHWVDKGHLPVLGLPEILAFLGVGGLWVGNIIRGLASHALRPLRDPRVHESMALTNY